MDSPYTRRNGAAPEGETYPQSARDELSFEGRECPACGLLTIAGMRGSMDSICNNCGYKDPCCYD